MNTRLLPLTLGGLVLMSSAMPTQARDFESSAYLTGLLGYHAFDSEWQFENDPSIAAGLGYEFNRNIAAEFIYGGADLERKPDDFTDIDARFMRLDLLYHFDNGSWRPFIIGGGGGFDYEIDNVDTNDTQFNLGAGIKHEVSDSIDIRFDARGVYTSENEAKDAMMNLGINVLFAGFVIPPKDSDADGIFDDEDQCPNTRSGADVDTMGCEVFGDSDRDGITDDIDQCPDTPVGIAVDAQGCPVDSDGDGITDDKDQCAGTPEGAKVDELGCPVKLMETVTIELSVNFELGSTSVNELEMSEVKKLADFLQAYPGARIVVEGHTDAKGSAELNQRISEERAEAVRQAAIDNFGVSPDRIGAVGYGESRPIADNATATGRQMNRRVVGRAEATVEK